MPLKAIGGKINSQDLNDNYSYLDSEKVGKSWMPFVKVTDYGATGDGISNDADAIREAIKATPEGGQLIFPPTDAGYKVAQTGNENYLFLIDKEIQLMGFGMESKIVLDVNLPITCDVFFISPQTTSTEGYKIEGIAITSASGRPGRHAFHLDISDTGQKLSRMIFRHNFLYPTGGWSIYLTNPINTDGFFTSQIEENLILSGISLIRGGDSLTISKNTFAGYNGLDVSLVQGSNTFVFAFNNFTARGGIILRNGNNCKFIYNNIEIGFADTITENGAMLDLDGGDTTEVWGLLSIGIVGNNFTYRSTAPDGIDAIRINKSRRVLVENNFISSKNSKMIHITSLAKNTSLGYNLYSSSDPEGIILDDGLETIKREVHSPQAATGMEEWDHVAENVRRRGSNRIERFDKTQFESKSGSSPAFYYIWDSANNAEVKESINSQVKNADGTLGTSNPLMYFTADKVRFPGAGFEIKDSIGSTHTLSVDSSGRLLIDGTIVGTQS